MTTLSHIRRVDDILDVPCSFNEIEFSFITRKCDGVAYSLVKFGFARGKNF